MTRKVTLENEQLVVVLDLGNNRLERLVDKRGRHEWKGGASLVEAECWDCGCDRPHPLRWKDAHVSERKSSSNELSINVAHDANGIAFDVCFALDGDQLRVRVPITELVEAKPAQFVLKSLSLNPPGFVVRSGEDGFLLLPNYSGVACRFTKKTPCQHRDLIYLRQSQWENIPVLPVFGMVHGQSAHLAIVESGEFDTEVASSVHWGDEPFYAVHPVFNFRFQQNDELDKIDRVVAYHFLSGEEACVAGMAKRYRRFLMDGKGMRPLRDKVATSPEAAYVHDAYGFIKIFCAVKEAQQDCSTQFRISTTFDEAGQIMRRLKREGIEKARFILVGWNWDGHDGRYPSRFPVDQRLGGEEGLRRLTALARELDYQITFHDNYSDAYRCSPEFDERIMIKSRDGRLAGGGVWAGGQSFFPCPEEAVRRYMHRDMPRIKELGLRGWYYLDGTPRALRGCHDPVHGHSMTRRAEGEGIVDQYRVVKAHFGGCAVEMPTAFVLPEVDEVAHIPCLGVWPMTSPLKELADEATPFFHIAVHGLILYHLMNWSVFPRLFGSVENGILKEAELGAMPRVEVTFNKSQFGVYNEHLRWIKKEYDLLCRRLGRLQLEFIEGHRMLDGELSETLFSDGTCVLVNYKDSRRRAHGKSVPAKGVLILNGRRSETWSIIG